MGGAAGRLLGGGQLLADADLNFPIKIAAVSRLARARDLPAAVFGVGVSKDWSPRGAALFRRAMMDLRPGHVAVRDEASAANWSAHFPDAALPPAGLCRDPGLLTAAVYPQPARTGRARPLVGLGVVHPLTLNMHSHGAPLSIDEALGAWAALVEAITARGMDVALFTNGPADDEAFLDRILLSASELHSGKVSRLAKPEVPADLVRSIAGCDAIAAHRLHANIIAFSCKVAHVGLGWDAKLPAFFASVGRDQFVTDDLRAAPPGAVADLLLRAIQTPVPGAVYDAAISETWSGIRTCAAALDGQTLA